MSNRARAWFTVGVIAVVIIGAFFIPHEFVVPEWRMQVVDTNGRPVPGVVVHQEWTHPVVDGMIFADSQTADPQGWVTLPRRSIRTTVGLGILTYPLCRTESCPSAHAFVCWNLQVGDIFWDNNHRHTDNRLPLRKGSCPYG